jgi:hypothetical protein
MGMQTLITVSCILTGITWTIFTAFIGVLLRFGGQGVQAMWNRITGSIFGNDEQQEPQPEAGGRQGQFSGQQVNGSRSEILRQRAQNLEFAPQGGSDNTRFNAQQAGQTRFGANATPPNQGGFNQQQQQPNQGGFNQQQQWQSGQNTAPPMPSLRPRDPLQYNPQRNRPAGQAPQNQQGFNPQTAQTPPNQGGFNQQQRQRQPNQQQQQRQPNRPTQPGQARPNAPSLSPSRPMNNDPLRPPQNQQGQQRNFGNDPLQYRRRNPAPNQQGGFNQQQAPPPPQPPQPPQGQQRQQGQQQRNFGNDPLQYRQQNRSNQAPPPMGQNPQNQRDLPPQNPNQGQQQRQQSNNPQQGLGDYRPPLRPHPTVDDANNSGRRRGRDGRKGDDFDRIYDDGEGRESGGMGDFLGGYFD